MAHSRIALLWLIFRTATAHYGLRSMMDSPRASTYTSFDVTDDMLAKAWEPKYTSVALEESSHSFDVTAYGAKGDNSTDCSKSFQAALDAAAEAHGELVYVPPGLYIISGNLTIPRGVTLSGSYRVVPSHGGKTPLDDGTVLIPTGQRGTTGCARGTDDLDCHVAFITLQQNSLVRGLVVYYQEQETEALPVPYPWTFVLGGSKSAPNAALEDIELLGCWNCISAVRAARHYIARVQGQPLNIGVFVDETYDIGRLEDVHFNPWFSASHPFIYHQTTHGRAFVMGRSDWEYVFNTFAFAYAIGYHFIQRDTGSMNGNFLGIGMDLATNASVQVDASQPYGILITNGEFTAFCDTSHHFCPNRTDILPVHVRTGSTNRGAVKFVSSAFWGPAANVAVTDGQGTVSFTECHFDSWDHTLSADGKSYEKHNLPAIHQLGGTLILSQNEFTKAGRHLEIAQGSQKTIFTENILKGNLTIAKHAPKAKVIVANNADDSPVAYEEEAWV